MNANNISIVVNGQTHAVAPGTSVAVALLQLGVAAFHTSPDGHARGPVCGMGVCAECRVAINGAAHQRSCMIACADGMRIETERADV